MKTTMIRLACALLCCALLPASFGFCAALGYEDTFQTDGIINIEITLPEADWQSMLENPTAEEYKSATVTIGETTVENVGFRTKGNSSLTSVSQSDSDRYSFRIKFDKYEKGQTFKGLDELVVNNMFSDPSYMREYLTYEALAFLGAPTPLTSYANIYINGELFGFYLCVEALDDSFVERVFGSDGGNLYKQEQGSTLLYEEGSNYPKSELKVGDDTQKEGLKNFIKVLNEMPEGEKGEIESVLDVNSALAYIAVNTVLGNYDSYNGNMAQNYYLYDQNGTFTVVGWDYNMSFAGFGGGWSQAATIPIDEPVMNVSLDKTPLIKNLLAVPEYLERYHDYIRQLLIYLDGFEERVAALANVIRPYVAADPTKFVTMEQFEANITYSETTGMESAGMPQDAGGLPQNAPDGQAPPKAPEDGQMPEGQTPPELPNAGQTPPEKPENSQIPEGQAPPEAPEDGFAPQDGFDGGGRGHGGMTTGGQVSIVNFVRARTENLKAQLSGELPTTGNTTMNGGLRGPGGNRPNGRPDDTQNPSEPEQKPITVTVMGEPVTFDVAPQMINDRTMVPMRAVFEALGAKVGWNGETQTVTAQKDSTAITLAIGSETAYVNGSAITLDAPAVLVENRTMVPVRFVAEAFGYEVTWDGEGRQVAITEK